MNLYFDNAASCRPFDWAMELFRKTSLEYYANQEAGGALGVRTKKLVREASARLSGALAPGADVFWCNTGTDALSAAVQMHCASHPGTEIATTGAEHPALKQAIRRFAAQNGITVRYARLARNGRVDMDSLRTQLSTKTSMLAVHHVNAETGLVQDLAGIRELLDSTGLPHPFFLADTTQSAGKLRIPWEEAKLDFCTVSGCKIGAPCGAALLYRDPPDRIITKRIQALRGHEHAVGRCIPAAVHVLSQVVETIMSDADRRADRIGGIRRELLRFIREKAGCKVMETIRTADASPYILHLIFPEHQGAVLVRILESQGVSAAAGSACMAETPAASETLTAMGYAGPLAFGAFRLSFWDDTMAEDVELFKNILISALKNY